MNDNAAKPNPLLEYIKACGPYKGPRGKDFKGSTYYDEKNDWVEHHWEWSGNEGFYADGPLFFGVTAMRTFSDKRVVGVKIRGIKAYLDECRWQQAKAVERSAARHVFDPFSDPPAVGSFKPCSYYDPDNDYLEHYWAPDPHYADTRNNWTGFVPCRSQDTDKIVGFQAVGLLRFLKQQAEKQVEARAR